MGDYALKVLEERAQMLEQGIIQLQNMVTQYKEKYGELEEAVEAVAKSPKKKGAKK